MNNILQVYEGYIATSNMEGLRKYHSSLMRTLAQTAGTLSLTQSLYHRNAISSLLDIKARLALSHGIRMDVSHIDLLCEVKMADSDLCQVLGHLIDNALGAAACSSDKEVYIHCQRRPSAIKISISNSVYTLGGYSEETPKNVAGTNIADREDLYAVHEIIRSYDKSALYVSHTDAWHTVSLFLQITDNKK